MTSLPYRTLFLFGLAALLGLACGLAAPAAATPPVQDLSALDTQVALTVAAARVEFTATVQQQATEQAASQTPAPPSATQAPTDTPQPTDTPPPTATATLANEDPRAALGDPDWRDPFNAAGNWTLFNTDDVRTEIKDGKFLYTMKTAQGPSSWTISWPAVKDFYLEATAITPAACAGKDRYGLMFRAPDPNHGYIFSFSCDGMYRLATWDGKDFDILIDWTADAAILAGPNQTNRIGVRAVGNTIRLYANGVLLDEITDSEYNDEYKFGFNVGAEKTDGFTVAFDEIAYWEIK
ncbi:MAG: hypothetical protein HYZ26_00770 [Chloroflexi bacterium]|nr:hypothetical protein [Chloroflexota bacterium]